jgi:plasmid rolling circle replication initiator protein Rep
MGKGEAVSKFYLTNLSPNDKPWDTHRSCADKVGSIYEHPDFKNYSLRIDRCAKMLLFGSRLDVQGRRTIKLKSAFFCRVRNCPVCQWRRSLMWKSRLGEVLPVIEKDYPKARWLYLTLTVRNCPIMELRETIKLMNSAWQRLTQLKVFPALGFFKSLEVTKGDDGTAHPHFHVLMMVPNSYFQGTKYIKQDKWVQMWKKAMRLDYDPSVDIRAVKSKSSSTSNILEIIPEIAKYSVKEEDLISDANWMIEYTRQIYKMRAVSLGGVLKKYLTEEDATNEELILGDSENELGELVTPFYVATWDKLESRYGIQGLDDDKTW